MTGSKAKSLAFKYININNVATIHSDYSLDEIMRRIKLPLVLPVSFLLASCAGQNVQPMEKPTLAQQQVNQVKACSNLDALISEYDTNFDNIKGKAISTRISSIWRAKHDLIGNNCQVWSWGDSGTTYSCNQPAPNKEVALEYYNRAKEVANQCLADKWQPTESERKNGNGQKIEFSQPNNNLQIAMHLVPTSGLFKTEWTVYYYVGDNKRLK